MCMQDFAVGFRNVSETSDPGAYVLLLDELSRIDSLQDCKRQMLALLNPKIGDSILDVGCGTGADVMALASLVGNAGRAIGVDNSEIMIAEARQRSAGSGLPVEWRLGDAQCLDFADNTFDGCKAERIFVHIEDPHKLLTEMIRVVRPGGRIIVFDIDGDALIINTSDRALNRKTTHTICDSLRNGWIGRQLPSMMRGSGLEETFIIPHTLNFPVTIFRKAYGGVLNSAREAGVLTDAEVSRWWEQIDEAEQQGKYFGALQGFIVGGSKSHAVDH
jgi:ubiquinone/menaquinone biosynthesis C-methylase UbiE